MRPRRLLLLWTRALCRVDAEDALAAAVRGGVDCVQIREKQLTGRELYQLTLRVRELLAGCDVELWVNDRPDVAEAAGADGVHLGQDDLPVRDARAILPARIRIGASAHSLAQVRDAVADGADVLGFGPMFATETKPHEAPIGPRELDDAVRLAERPVFAIGGLDAARIRVVGARRAAVSRSILAASDPESAAAAIRAALESNGPVT